MKHLSPFSDFELVIESRKYEHINFIPPKTVSNQCKKGLKYRRKYKSSKGEKSVSMAKKLMKRDKLQPYQVKQMATYFSRHRERELLDKYKEEPWKDRRYVTYLLWGGESGRAWAERVRTQIVKADKKK